MARLLAALLIFGAITECAAQYGGPSLLSRGGNRPGRRGRALPKLNVYASVRGMYESGLLATALTEAGEVKPVDTPGVLLEGGAYGGKDWRRVSIGADYRGDYRHTMNLPNKQLEKQLNGTNQVIAIDTTIRQSRRTTLNISGTGGTTNRAFGGFAAPAFGGGSRPGVPLSEVFDVRTYFTQAEAGFVHQRSARTSIAAGLSAFFVKRNGNSLINSQGYRAQGIVSRQINRRTTLLGNYQWLSFTYPSVLATSFIHGIAGGIEHSISHSWNLTATGGIYLIHSTGTQQITLSPEVAEILGRPTGEAFFRRTSSAPLIDATAVYTQERGSLRLRAASTMVPGNGAYLTSVSQTANAGYSYAGTSRLSLGLSAGYQRMRSRSLNMSNLNTWQAGGGISYRLARSLQLMSQYDRRIFKTSAIQGRSGNSISIGLAWNPSRFPIAIW